MDNDSLPFAFNVFYTKYMLEVGDYSLAYDRFGQPTTLPTNNTDTVKWRRYERLPKRTTPLTPGVTPPGSIPEVTDVTATVQLYGDWVPVIDEATVLNPDPVILRLMPVLKRQWSETINEIARDGVTAGGNVQYADASSPRTNTARGDITSDDYLTLTEIQIAVQTLKVAGAVKLTEYVRPNAGYATSPLRKCYIGICDPYTTTDLKNTPGFLTPDKYVGQGALLEDEVGSLDEVRFVEDTEGQIYTGEGNGGIDVHATVIFGADAYGVVEVSNQSTDVIFQPLGSAGASDPLKQRGSLGWKQWYAVKILNDDFIVRVEHATRQG